MQSIESQYIAKAKPEIAKLLFDKSGRPRRIPLSSTQIEIALERPFSYWIVIKALKQMVEKEHSIVLRKELDTLEHPHSITHENCTPT